MHMSVFALQNVQPGCQEQFNTERNMMCDYEKPSQKHQETQEVRAQGQPRLLCKMW